MVILIVGGTVQGKCAYALQKTGYTKADVCDGSFSDGVVLNHLHLAIRTAMQQGADAWQLTECFLSTHPDCVLVCDEVGSGIVPIDPFEREYRELVGRICCMLAARADQVYRVCCGIGTVLKQ